MPRPIERGQRYMPGLDGLRAIAVLAVIAYHLGAGWATLAQPSQLPSLRGAVASATLYVNNWWLIAQHISYFARFGPPSPLGHLWSLSIEEQFYLLWPWLLVAGVRPGRGRSPWARIRIRLALV